MLQEGLKNENELLQEQVNQLLQRDHEQRIQLQRMRQERDNDLSDLQNELEAKHVLWAAGWSDG